MYKFVGWNLVFLLLLLASLFVGTQGQGDISKCFPKKATYKVGQKANFTCPRPCDVTGDSIDFYVFDSDSGRRESLFYYLNESASSYRNDCAEDRSNGSVIASFVIGQQEAGTSLTIYCTDSASRSPCDSLIQPVLIHVEESVEVCINTTPSSPSPVHTSSTSPVYTISSAVCTPLPISNEGDQGLTQGQIGGIVGGIVGGIGLTVLIGFIIMVVFLVFQRNQKNKQKTSPKEEITKKFQRPSVAADGGDIELTPEEEKEPLLSYEMEVVSKKEGIVRFIIQYKEKAIKRRISAAP